MEDISKKFLEHAKLRMKRIGKTQSQLSRETGIAYSTINKTFNYSRTLELSLAVKIAKNLNLSIDTLTNQKVCQSLDDYIDEMDEILKKIKKFQKNQI